MLTLGLIAPGDLAILMAGTGTTSVTSPGRRHGYCDEAKVGG
jgi:hypothetical protein